MSTFAPGATTAGATLTGLVFPNALVFDSSGNLYVTNQSGTTVSKFAPGATTASATLSGLDGPNAMVFDSNGNLYVANYYNNTVSKFAPGAVTASATLTGLNEPDALAFDSSGNLYVANYGTTTVSKFAPGVTTAGAMLAGLSEPESLVFDSSGNLYVGSYGTGSVSKFAPGATTASTTLTGFAFPLLAVDSVGDLYVANYLGTTVSKFAPGATTASATLTGLSGPETPVFDSSGNLFVANSTGTTVSKFTPASITASASAIEIQSSVESRPMLVGGSNSNPVAGINLTTAELAQIETTAGGSITIGDGQQTGNITLSTATPATTAGAAVNVVQEVAGGGQIILDDGAGTATALNGNGGSISITAGTGGITAGASGSTAEIATTGARVTLLTSGPIGTSTNRIQFADDSNTAQQVVFIGSTTVQPSSVYLDGLGSLTLDNIFGAGTNPTIDVTARTNLVVASGATINSGSSPLNLGADLTAAETGDNGVGTLSISSGATVTTTGTITLRGASMNIDTSSNPAVIGGTRALGTTASAALTGLNNAYALSFDASGNLYVVNYQPTGTVSKFVAGSTTPSATLIDLSYPDTLAFDTNGNLYVANYYLGTVSKFVPGATTASATLTGLSDPYGLAFDSSGNLYVVNQGSNTVSRFAPGATTANATLTGLNDPDALIFDTSGNLFVANDMNPGTVSKFAPGATTASTTLTGLNDPNSLAFDSSGNLYVANSGSAVSKFAPGATTVSATIGGLNNPDALAFDSADNLYVAYQSSNTVGVFAAGATTANTTLTGLNRPDALAFDSSGNLYVANYNGGTVSKFTAGSITSAAATAVVIQSSVESRPMQIGTTTNTLGSGIYLTTAELAHLYTTSTGTVTIGDSSQTGNITFSTATPATTAGASVNVVQSTAGSGEIILDDASGSGTGLTGNGGKVTLTAGTGGVMTTLFATGTPLATKGFTASGNSLSLALGFAPTVGTQLTVVNNTATPAGSNPINGTFSNLAQGATVTLNYNATPYYFTANYQGGDGNDLVLTNVAGPTTQLVVTTQPSTVTAGNSFNLTITAEDAQGNVTTSFTGSETVALASNPGGSTLGGTLTVSAVNGVATFSGLTLNNAGDGYTLQVTSGTLTSAVTNDFTVAAGAITATAVNINAIAETNFNGLVATFTDTNPMAPLSDFPPSDVTIHWGDGSSSNATQITQPGGAGTTFQVYGTHTYAAGGNYPVSVSIQVTAAISTFASGFDSPDGLAFGPSGTLYVANSSSGTVSAVSTGGGVSTFVSGFTDPQGLVFDRSGNLYVSQGDNSATVEEVSPGGTVSVYTTAYLAGLYYPNGLAFDSQGDLYAANTPSANVTVVTPGGGSGVLFAANVDSYNPGGRSVTYYVGESLSLPSGLAFDSSGNLYISNIYSGTVTEVTPGGAYSTFASGFDQPEGLAFDSQGNLYVANNGNNTVSEVTPSGVASTFVSSGLDQPEGLAFDADGNLYVANGGNNTVTEVQLASTVTGTATVVGVGATFTDNSPSLNLALNSGASVGHQHRHFLPVHSGLGRVGRHERYQCHRQRIEHAHGDQRRY